MSTAATVERSLSTLLCRLVGEQTSGVLTARRGKHKRLFCLRDGAIVFAASNVVEEQFDRRLLSEGLLTPEELEEARGRAKLQYLKLTRYLIAQKHPPAAALTEALMAHVRELLESTLKWPDGEYSFNRGRPNLGGEVTVELRLPTLLIEHARGLDWPTERLRMRIGPPNATPLIDPSKATFLARSAQDEVVAFLLENCDGSETIEALAKDSPSSFAVVLRTLYALAGMGLVQQPEQRITTPAKKKAATRAECEALLAAKHDDHYAVLGLTNSTTEKEIRDSYYYLARRYHPDRFRSGPLVDLLDRIEAYFTSVTEAYNTLIDEVLRAEYDSQLADRSTKDKSPKEDSANLARSNYARARVLIGKRQYQDSVRFLENAVSLDDNQADYHMELGRVLIRNPRRRDDAERHLNRAAELNPAGVDAYLALGQLFRKTGRDAEAAASFREVLRWEPENITAQNELREISEEKQSEDGGILRGLFRK